MKAKLSNNGYLKLLTLQDSINKELFLYFKDNIEKQDDHLLAKKLIEKVEEIIETLNKELNYNFGRCDYSGDINYQNSEQTYCDGKNIGSGIVLHFHGFSVQAYLE